MKAGGALALAMLVGGCATTPKPTAPAASPGLATQQMVNGTGFSAICPAGWKLIAKSGDYALAAVPDTPGADANDETVAIEVPQLPPHIPGFIPLGSVAGGYVQDLKKRYPDQTIDNRSAVKVDGTDARRIVSSFQNHDKPWRELAVLAVHGDHVYVITGDCAAADFAKTEAAFNAVVASVKWTTPLESA